MQTRQVVALVTVIAIIALAIGTTIGYDISSGKTTTTSVTTQTIVNTSSNSNTKAESYELRFNQTGVCSPPRYFIPWSVNLSNGMTIQEPQGNLTQCCGFSPSSNYSSIVFSVPNGNYSYAIGGQQGALHLSPATGNVTIANTIASPTTTAGAASTCL